jgi:DNA repair protein RecN (Recombination protein N)
VLLELEIENLALIEKLHLALTPGLNILTGETGAGKSILIDAIGLVLGARASTDFIRAGADQARVTALFQLPALPALDEALQEAGIELDENRQLLISRELNASGKSICRINGRLATVSLLRSLGQQLVDIHGQHEHQSLLRPESHITYLDSYGDEELSKLRQLVQDCYHTYRFLQKKLANLEEEARETAQKLDFYSFQRAEIAAAKLAAGEEEKLLAQRDILRHTERLFQLCGDSYRLLYGDELGGSSVLDSLGQVVGWLQQAAAIDGQIGPLYEGLESISFQIEEIAREIRSYLEGLELNPGSLEEVEERLYVISELKRKYGNSIEEILAYYDWLEKEIDALEQHRVDRKELEEKYTAIKKELAAHAQRLSQARMALAKELEEDIRRELAYLGMEKTIFSVSISQQEDKKGIDLGEKRLAVTKNGIDQVEFLLAPNPGEPPKPLSRIASGGELSRIMLALKTVLSAVDTVPTMIFDEIDAGIGGRTAQAVAERLAALGRTRQVLCVTHLPQIATMADSHYHIKKEVVEGRTYTRVRRLAEGEQVEELARMQGGAKVTETTRKHAREMLRLAAKYKEEQI